MNILNKIKVVNPEILKNYKVLSEKVELLKNTLIRGNNQSEAIFPCNEYEKLHAVIKYLDSLENEEVEKLSYSLPKEGFLENNIVDYFYIQAQKKEIKVKQNEINQMNLSSCKIVAYIETN